MSNARRSKQAATIGGLVGAIALASSMAVAPAAVAGIGAAGAVFTLSNDVTGNSVLSWTRSSKGQLTPGPSYETGGLGNGGGLGSQGAVTISPDREYLVAVNAGSDEISAFSINGTALSLIDTVPSGGDLPISVTVDDGVVYALNAGGVPNISGYTLDAGGLRAIDGSVRDLPDGAAGPAQVSFTPAGDQLVVTEKATNRIDTFAVQADGTTAAGVANASAGVTPFGFDFDNKGHLLVSDAVGGATGASTASSYNVNADGTVGVVSGSVATGQSAACWLVVTNNGKYAFTTNTGSGTVSSYAVGNNGSLTLINSIAATPGGAPIDAAFDASSKSLFTLDSRNDKIDGFAVGNNGSLRTGVTITGLPVASVGLASF